MFTNLNVSHLTTQGIKKYLSDKGYRAKVENMTRSNKDSVVTFSIKLPDSQAVSQEILHRIRSKSESNFRSSTTTRLLLNQENCVEILPLLPNLKTSEGVLKQATAQVAHSLEKNVLVNTQNGNKVNTFGEGAQAYNSPKSVARTHSDGTSHGAIRRTRTQAIKENALALEIVNSSDFESRILASEERVILENYAGVGGQYQEGNQSNNIDALTQFYTPNFISEKLYKRAYELGFPKDGKVLEPSCGVGRLIKHAPDQSKVTAFEISEIPYKISTKLYPKASIHHKYFEQAFLKEPRFTDVIRGTSPTWIQDYPFDLVIGNPPYGKHKNRWQSFFGNPKFPQIEFFFMYYGAKLLKPGGLLIYVTSSNFIRTGLSYQVNKEKVLELLQVVGAYRMPNKFMELTDVGTDILFFRKK
jgi:hypothetical protein